MKNFRHALLAIALSVALNAGLLAQTQNHYLGSNVTGQLTLVRTVNLQQATSAPQGAKRLVMPLSLSGLAVIAGPGAEISRLPSVFGHPTPSSAPGGVHPAITGRRFATRSFFGNALTGNALTAPVMQSLPVGAPGGSFGFDGLTHYDQRQASSGNQFSIEPPNPSIAVANGFVLEGVNNAVRVYTTAGVALTPPVASDQLFGVAPEIDRSTFIFGVSPTDMRVYFDQDVNRWFVLQRSQDNDIFGDPLNQSHIYLAVSQTADPTGTYNIYVMDTSDAQNPSCPCVPDYPQIGSDHYGFFISANEYNTSSIEFVDASILAISKAALASGVNAPATYRFGVVGGTGYEFAIQPASTPPGAFQVLGNGGMEYFVSSQGDFSSDSNLAIWALSNTASLQSPNPSMQLIQTTVPTLTYYYPSPVTQRPGPIPYGDFLSQPLAFIDGGLDSRIQSVVYSGGRLFATLATEVLDETGQGLTGGAYVILSPTFRGGVLGASVLNQGYLLTNNNSLLRPAVAVNASGRGAIAFTLAGPDYYPSAAFVNIDAFSTPSLIHLAAAGTAPEDGFTGYPGGFAPGVARWGDYSTAVTNSDGSIWMVSEYIPNGVRTQLANWGTFVAQYIP